MKKPPKKLLIAVAAAVVIGAVAAYFLLQPPFRYAGTLEATKVDLSARLATAIEELRVREGDRVRRGDVLALFGAVRALLARGSVRRSSDRPASGPLPRGR